MKGPKPQPTALKVLRGNPGKRALPKDEPAPLPFDGDAPETLSPAGLKEWSRLAPRLRAVGLLSELDVDALEELSETRALLRQARAKLAEERQLLLKVHGQRVPNQWLGLVNTLQDRVVKLLLEFGMTPSGRTRVTKASTGKPKGNKFAGIGATGA